MAGNKNSGNRSGRPRARGAGRKPKTAREHWLSGDASRAKLALVQAPADAGKRVRPSAAELAASIPVIGPAGEVPAYLSEPEQAYWNLWAPLAIENGTLTDSTRPGFVLLCRTAVDVAEVRGEIRERGILFEKVDNVGGEEVRELKRHPLWPDYRSLRQQLDAHLARFGLTGMGRPASSAKPEKDNERERLRQLLAVR
jgi:hypothetical protein